MERESLSDMKNIWSDGKRKPICMKIEMERIDTV